MTNRTRLIRHVRVELALHELRPGGTRPLLLLHGLGEQTPAAVPPTVAGWDGSVWGLDFTGHGGSAVPAGGGYTAEILMADADAALAELARSTGEPTTVLGRGLGAYVALLVAGARPEQVRGAILSDGPGLAGGGPGPGFPSLARPPAPTGRTPDPYALLDLSRDIRPPDYATTFVRQALQLSGLDTPIAVTAVVRPGWLAAVVDEPGVASMDIAAALRLFSSQPERARR